MNDDTLEVLFADLAKKMNALMSGMTVNGRPLSTNGYKGVVTMVRGDWEFFTQALRFPRWDSSPNMCWMCSATNNIESDLLWSKRGWRRTLRSHEDYLRYLHHKGCPLPALFAVRSLRLEGVALDCLHVLDQGISSHSIANALVEVMKLGQWGTTQQDQIDGLRDDIQKWHEANHQASRIQGKITFERLKTSADWPKLKAKGAATRHLSRYAAELTARYNTGSTHDKRRWRRRSESAGLYQSTLFQCISTSQTNP
eukprot:2034500-Pyramimonas_sp.AAC.1